MIRILHVIGSMGMGGAETILMNLYRNIDRKEIQFDFAVHTSEKCIYDDEIQSLCGNIYHFRRFNGCNFFEYIKQWKDFFSNHSEHTIVHGHIGSCASLYLGVANKFGKITIAHSHNMRKNGDYSIHNLAWSVYSFPTRFVSKYFLACSYGAGKDRFGKKIVKSQRFNIINNGINAMSFAFDEQERVNIRRSLGVGEKTVIGNISRLVAQKNHLFLIDVFLKYLTVHPDSVLVIVGDGILRKQLLEKVNDLGIQKSVIFTGASETPQKYLSAFDYFVFPSTNEGLGISVIEAQASGLPVICSDAIPSEACVSNLISFLPLGFGPDYWASSIGQVPKNEDRRGSFESIIKNGYDISNSVQQLSNYYYAILQNN